MKILVIFTGGTIGSSIKDGYKSPDDANNYKLIDMFKSAKQQNELEFEIENPYMILSENMNGEYLCKLARVIKERMTDESIDGIIVTHGTDTIQYTAVALEVFFKNSKRPIVIVSSNYPLEDERANGLDNFVGAIEYIKENTKCSEPKGGVFVSYRNDGKSTKMFIPSRILRHDNYSDIIRSIDINTDTNINEYTNMISNKGFESEVLPIPKSMGKNSPVKFILPYVGQNYDIPDNNIKAILFGSYHSGTLNTDNEDFRKFCLVMKEKNIPVYICGVPNETEYESSKYYQEFGIKVLPIGTDIYWYMRIWIEIENA